MTDFVLAVPSSRYRWLQPILDIVSMAMIANLPSKRKASHGLIGRLPA
jgi:hypothetical protein